MYNARYRNEYMCLGKLCEPECERINSLTTHLNILTPRKQSELTKRNSLIVENKQTTKTTTTRKNDVVQKHKMFKYFSSMFHFNRCI